MSSFSASSSFASSSMMDSSRDRTYEFAKKKYGKSGKQIPVFSNYFPIKVNCRKIYHYNIDIQVHDFVKDPSDRNVPQRNKLSQQKKLFKDCNFVVFEKFIVEHKELFASEPIFDGRKNLYSKTRLNMPDKTFTCTIKQKIQEKKFPVSFDISLTTPKESHELDLSILNEPNVRNAEKEIQALDILLSYGAKKYKLAVGNNLFMRKVDLQQLTNDQRKAIRFELGEMKEVSFGHYQSAKLTENGTQLNVDRVAIVFNQGGKLLSLVEKLCTEMRSGPSRRDNRGPPQRDVEINSNFRLNPNEKALLNAELKGLNFEVDHISYKPKNRIFCITEKNVSEIFFDQKMENNQTQQVSVKTYFERVYKDYLDKLGRDLFPNLPCVQVGKTNPKFFPLEVVSIIDDQYNMKKLKPKHQAEMTKRCGQQKPTERFRESELQVKNLITARGNQTDYLKYFDIQMQTKYSECKGRVLDPAALLFSNNRKTIPNQGQWRQDAGYIEATQNIGADWLVINFTKDYNNQMRFAPQRDQVDAFIKTVINCSKTTGNNFTWPCEVIYDEAFRGRKDLEDAMFDYLNDHKNVKIIIYIIPKLDELYNSIKFLSEIVFGRVTQCVSQDKKNQFAQMSYVSNLMLKINAKLGGTNLMLDRDCKVAFLRKKCMIMGLDCTHPAPHDRLGNSIASVVATYDKNMVNYYSRCVVQPKPRTEIVALDEITKEMMEYFKNRNNFYPEYVLVYRDGVSEGQFQDVIDKEINLMKKAFCEISPNCNPKITFIVVQKRHHTRFLPVRECDRIQKSQNVLPGTVIDNTITSNYYHDFYLCAHFGALGTSRPTRYIVLHDDSEFSGDEIQQTTNLLSYLFPRCTKAVSVPPPILYAHLSCKRARSYLFTIDNNRGTTFGEKECTPSEIKELNQKIQVKENLRSILYYI